jgi:hypothetical protein
MTDPLPYATPPRPPPRDPAALAASLLLAPLLGWFAVGAMYLVIGLEPLLTRPAVRKDISVGSSLGIAAGALVLSATCFVLSRAVGRHKRPAILAALVMTLLHLLPLLVLLVALAMVAKPWRDDVATVFCVMLLVPIAYLTYLVSCLTRLLKEPPKPRLQ